MRARLSSVLASSGKEDGFTIIEVLVAAFVLVLAALAVFMGFAGAIHGIQRGREMQQGVSVAQREMERIRVEEFRDIGLTSTTVTPAPAKETQNPNSRVAPGGTEFNLSRSGTAKYRPFASGDLTVERTGVTSVGGSKMNVFRYVVCEETACHAKRIVVDVVPVAADNQSGYQHSYYELQSTVVETG